MSTAQALLQRVFPSRGAAKQSSAETPDEGAEANTTPVHQNGLSSTEEKENEMSDPVDTPEAKAPAVDAKAEQSAGKQAELGRMKAVMASAQGKANPEYACELMEMMPEASAEQIVNLMAKAGIGSEPAQPAADNQQNQPGMQALTESDVNVAPNTPPEANGHQAAADWGKLFAQGAN